MGIGLLLGGAGAVAEGRRDQEAVLRKAREDQLRMEALNRMDIAARRARDVAKVGAPAARDAYSLTTPEGDLPAVGVRPPARTVAIPAPTPAAVAAAKTQAALAAAAKIPENKPAVEVPEIEMTQGEFLALPEERQNEILQQRNDQRTLKAFAGIPASLGGVAADLVTAPYRGYAMAVEGLGSSRVGRAFGLTDPGQRLEVWGSGTASGLTGDEKSFPLGAKGTAMIADNMRPWTKEDYLATLPATRSPKRPGHGGGKTTATYRKQKAAKTEALTQAGGASKFDRPTEYDVLIQQAAEQQGINPVIFKRLIGTESNFNPKAESYRGRNFGLGIGQINAVHGMSEEDMLNPAVALPAAAKILATYVNNAGGDYREALMAYKGASSEKGRASMAPVIDNDILVGLSGDGQVATAAPAPAEVEGPGPAPGATATLAATEGPVLREAVAQGARGVAPSATAAGRPLLKSSQFYLNNDPQALTRDMQYSIAKREELAQLANIYLDARTPESMALAMQLKGQVEQLDQGMLNLAGIQGVREMAEMNDPRRLERALSLLNNGNRYELRPFTDGTYDIYINGRLAHENVDGGEIQDRALSLFDPEYVSQKRENAKSDREAANKLRETLLSKHQDLVREIMVAQQNGLNQVAVERIKNLADVSGPSADGTYLIKTPDGYFYLNPEGGVTVKRGGEPITLSGVRKIEELRVE